jgi:hypothetical protein
VSAFEVIIYGAGSKHSGWKSPGRWETGRGDVTEHVCDLTCREASKVPRLTTARANQSWAGGCDWEGLAQARGCQPRRLEGGLEHETVSGRRGRYEDANAKGGCLPARRVCV